MGRTKTGPKNAESAESDPQKSKPSESNALRNSHLIKGSYRIMRSENHTHHTIENSYYDGGA